jgi:hypothetical protein
MNAWQRGQRPGFFHGSTKCFADAGHDNFILCHSNRRGSARFEANKLSLRITGGISCPVNAEKFLANSVRPVARRTRVKTSNNFRHSRQTTVCTSQFNPPSAPLETLARYWHCGHSKRNVLPTVCKIWLEWENFSSRRCVFMGSLQISDMNLSLRKKNPRPHPTYQGSLCPGMLQVGDSPTEPMV